MARTVAGRPAGMRITDFVSVGVLASRIPRPAVDRVLTVTGRHSQRVRQLPAHVMVYYVIALALYMEVSYGEVLRLLVEGLRWLGAPAYRLRNTGRSAISQARARLGWEPMARLYRDCVHPIASERTPGARYRDWRLVSVDGTTLDTADTEANAVAFGRPGASRGASAFPQVRLVSLLESGTRVLFGAQIGPCTTAEVTLADRALAHLSPGMLCLADRNFFAFARWQAAAARGAELLWRVKKNAVLPCHTRLADGSYLSAVYASEKDRRHRRHGCVVRVIEYQLDGVAKPEPLYRLVTTLLDPTAAPAHELAALYPERWEIETAFDELKTHLRGPRIVLRSKTPDLVRQELYGLLLAHFALRSLLDEAALQADVDPDTLSFVHAVRVVRRHLSQGAFPPSGTDAPDPAGGAPRSPR